MKNLALIFFLPVLMVGCTDKGDSTSVATTAQQAGAASFSGKALVQENCVGCHDLDGRGVAPKIPHLAAQREEYLLASLHAYSEGTRTHAALRGMARLMSDTDVQKVVRYYASQPPLESTEPMEAHDISLTPYEKGKAATAACVNCHGEDGNSNILSVPSLAGQQPLYFVTALQAYVDGARTTPAMEHVVSGLSKGDMENMGRYYALQTPLGNEEAPSFGDAAAGEPLSANCSDCHGFRGVSIDATVPSLAGQDAQYLLNATRAYQDWSRLHYVMHRFVGDLSDTEVENLAAFYATQEPEAAEVEKLLPVEKLATVCERCHGLDVDPPTLVVPKIRGQNRDYLIKTLRAYRDGNRGSSMMHTMILPRSDSIIESISAHYANLPAR
jgi:cytochrome c553